MLSVVGSLRSWQSGGHLPPGFDAAQGLRQLFPRGLTARLSWLARYVVTVESTGQTDSAVAMQVVGADGAGNWTYHGYVQDNVPSYDGSGQVIPSSRGGFWHRTCRFGWDLSSTSFPQARDMDGNSLTLRPAPLRPITKVTRNRQAATRNRSRPGAPTSGFARTGHRYWPGHPCPAFSNLNFGTRFTAHRTIICLKQPS